ncbi:MAG TPA: type IV secretory system conjugative DNA transfer family protein [Acidimicrobiales bacterium]|nr:type IV secretory system conjugative DNA transfer family protein [Acidimicrobiales bacterium]
MNQRPAGREPVPGVAPDAVLWLLMALFGLAVLVWAGAALAAALATRSALGVGLAEVGPVMARLPDNLGDPAAAWPPPVAARLPGAVLYWASQLAVVGAVVAAVVVGLRWRRGRGASNALGVRLHAGLGAGRDLRALVVREPQVGRVVVGRVGRRLVATEAQASLAVVGPSGCGKTAGLAIPALLEWEGPVLATSVKADLVEATLAHRARRGKVWVFDPTRASGAVPAPWSPLGPARTWAGALRIAAWLTDAAQPRRRDSLGDADYWYTQARKGLAPYLHAAALADADMAQVVRWVDTADQAEVTAILKDLAAGAEVDAWSFGESAPVGDEVLVAAEALWRKEDRLRCSIFATMENVVAAYADPGVGRGAPDEGIDLDEWLSGDHTIYVVAAAHDQARLRPVLSVLVAEAARRAFDAANAAGGTLARPCLLLLDEAGNIAPLAELPTYAATARAHNIALLTVWQDLAQLNALYGERAATVLNNHRAKLFASGIADTPTLDYLSALVGDERLVERNSSMDLAGGRRSISERTTYRRAAPPDALRRLRNNEALLVYGAEVPVRVRLRPWFADRRLHALATRLGD